MGVLDKCCGNCARSYAKDMDGYCACGVDNHYTSCDEVCDKHIMSINGWIEITPDSVDIIDDGSIVIVTDGTYYNKASEWHLSIGTMAKYGGYWYYVLPELKIE